jgi:hypothetical protein
MTVSTPPQRQTTVVIVLVLLVTYVAGYGLLRWRGVLVRNVYCGFLGFSSSINAQFESRKNGLTIVENAIAKPASRLYLPLRRAEEAYWSWRQDWN